ncbi:MAG: hypothetical protein ACJ8MO_39115, partial [Bacillus sp. (in: firmicutes)]
DAADQVQDVYALKKEYTQNRVDLISSIFQATTELNDEINEQNKKFEELTTEEKPEKPDPSDSEKLIRLKAKLTSTVSKGLSDQVFRALVQAGNDELSIAKDLTVTAINNVMAQRISADEVENAKKRVEEELKYTTLNDNLRNGVIELGRYAVIQNEFYDPNATEELRQQAVESVEPAKILQGQIIVEEGELINQDIYRQLKLVGLLDNERSFKPFIGLMVLITIILSSIYFYFYQIKSIPGKRQTDLLLYGIVFILSIFIMKIISMLQIFNFAGIGYLFPAALGGMLIKILIDEKLAILMSIIMAVCGSILFNEGITGTLNFSEGIYILFSALAGILFLSNQNQRSKILQAGSFAAIVNILSILALIFLPNGQFSGMEYGYYITTALVSGIGSAVLTIGLL